MRPRPEGLLSTSDQVTLHLFQPHQIDQMLTPSIGPTCLPPVTGMKGRVHCCLLCPVQVALTNTTSIQLFML